MNENQELQTRAAAGAVAKQDREASYQAFGSNEVVKLSVNIVRSMLVKPTAKGKLPTDAECFRFVMMCKARALNPFEGDAFLVGYDDNRTGGADFTIITGVQAFLKRAEMNPNFKGLESGVIVRDSQGQIVDREGDFIVIGQEEDGSQDDVILGGWATVHFMNGRLPIKKRCNLRTFYKDNSRWKADTAGMIVKCAEADALRTAFPNVLGGLYLAQEMARIDRGEAIDVSAHVSMDLPKTFADKREEAEAKFRAAGRQVRGRIEQAQADPHADDLELSSSGLAPEAKSPTEVVTVHQAFERDVMTPNNITFEALRKWLGETGSLKDPDSYASLEELPAELVERCAKRAAVIVKSLKTS